MFFSSHRQHLSFLEPRFNLLYKIDDKNQLSIAFDKTNQFLHLLTNNGVGLPTDLWVPLINELKGISAKQYSLNYSNRLNQKLTFELGLYYKSLNNLIEFEEGEGFIADGNWVEKVTQGTGTVYGVETSISGNIGNTQGFLNYTFSKSKRFFDNKNNGKYYFDRYDRRNSLKLTLMQKISSSLHFSLIWVYGTGHRTTIPQLSYSVWYNNINSLNLKEVVINSPQSINNYQFQPYHRLDISLQLFLKKNRGKSQLVIGVYNVYNRKNTFFVTFDNGNFDEISILPILPSISYGWQF